MPDRKQPRRASGRFVVRISPGQHEALREAARAAGVSMNDYCVRMLTGPGAAFGESGMTVAQRLTDELGERLVGVLVYGSWSRDELAEGSDVDLLVVLDPSVAITRELYRSWDAEPLRWGEHLVEPHFVHLPQPDEEISGFWAEAAIDGIVLFERSLELSRGLVGVRRRIVDGQLERRHAGGHPYWVTGTPSRAGAT